MRKWIGFIGILFIPILTGVFVFAVTCAPTDYLCFVSGPYSNLATQAKLDASGNLTLNGGLTGSSATITSITVTTGTIQKTVYGQIGVIASSATSAGSSFGIMIPVFLGGAANVAAEGSVLIASTPISGQITVAVSTGASHREVVGVAASAAASTAAIVNMYTSGIVNVLTTGTVNAGDWLFTTTTPPGYTVAANGQSSGTIVGFAVSTGTAAGGLTRVKLR